MKNTNGHQQHLNQVTLIGMLVAIGIVFGDIGTSPLYTFSAVIGSKPVEPLLALGGFSAIFWTLFFQTTVKYVIITLNADRGHLFALHADPPVFGQVDDVSGDCRRELSVGRWHYHAADLRFFRD